MTINYPILTHFPLDKVAAIQQTMYSDALSWMKYFVFSFVFVSVCTQLEIKMWVLMAWYIGIGTSAATVLTKPPGLGATNAVLG